MSISSTTLENFVAISTTVKHTHSMTEQFYSKGNKCIRSTKHSDNVYSRFIHKSQKLETT